MTSDSKAQVLYVHPHGHLNDLVVPAGAITSMNAISCSRLGRYAFEVTDDEISAASIVATDLHWSLGITGFETLVERIRRVNPSVPIVVGGITAGLVPATVLSKYPVDYVIQGDSEVAFASLVDAILAGRGTNGIPNVYCRNQSTVRLRRMTSAQFRALDCLTIDWFPTFRTVTGLRSAAFSVGRHFIVARGCPMRCPHCFGSHASSWGTGVLWQSPESFRATLIRADSEGVGELRLIVGKPGRARFDKLVHALEGLRFAGLPSVIGIFLCTAPSIESLKILEQAFPNGVTLSLVPPSDYSPVMSQALIEREYRDWTRVAEFVRGSDVVRLDIWTDGGPGFGPELQRLKDLGGAGVTVSPSVVWHMTRLVDSPDSPDWETVRNAVRPLWTFHLSRLLSPSIADVLAPYHHLNEVDELTPTEPLADKSLDEVRLQLRRAFSETCLPTLPDMSWWAVPVSGTPSLRRGDRETGVRYYDRLGGCGASDGIRVDPSGMTLFDAAIGAANVSLKTRLSGPCEGIALVPWPFGDDRPSDEWIDLLSLRGLCVLDLSDVPRDALEGGQVEIILMAHKAWIAFVDGKGARRAGGRADIGYLRRPTVQDGTADAT